MVRQTHRQNLSAGVELRFAAKNHFSVTNVKGGKGDGSEAVPVASTLGVTVFSYSESCEKL